MYVCSRHDVIEGLVLEFRFRVATTIKVYVPNMGVTNIVSNFFF